MRNFFSSIWFKCIATLLVIALVSGGLLAILNDVLFVTPEERTARAIKNIYGEEKEYSTVIDLDNEVGELFTDDDYGSINKVFIIDENDYLIHVTGINGYKNGTVTLWVLANVVEDVVSIEKVVFESSEKQTLMSKMTDEYYDKFTDGFSLGEKNIVTGATKSSTACSNAVNLALTYLQEEVK